MRHHKNQYQNFGDRRTIFQNIENQSFDYIQSYQEEKGTQMDDLILDDVQLPPP